MTQDEKINRLSRRSVLGGLGAIGVASAGAGLGTTAFFSDSESFENNAITAGEVALSVRYEFAADQGIRNEQNPFSGTNGGGETGVVSSTPGEPGSVSYQLDDVKPGDTGHLTFAFTIDDNPAYLWACARMTENAQNGVTNPERSDLLDLGFTESAIDASETDPWGGQLADGLVAKLVYWNLFSGTQIGAPIVDGSLQDVLDTLTNGVPLDANGDPEAGLSRECFPAASSLTFAPALAIVWELPETVGNEVQTDSVGFDLTFHAQQCRHDDGTTNPCLESVPGEGFPELEGSVWHARGIYGVGGGAGNRELDIRLPDDTQIHSGDENVAWPNGEAVPFELTIDSGDAVWTVGGSEVFAENAPLPTASAVTIMAKASNAGTDIEVSDITLDGASPSGPDSVAVDGTVGGQENITLDNIAFGEGAVIGGTVTMSWPAGSPPNREGLGFRIDV